ncbi:MAG: hypothetical protein OXG37_15700 [Actinomycetia bacterium]|nr:hypothetical protein [Actinomycetes bacterium]
MPAPARTIADGTDAAAQPSLGCGACHRLGGGAQCTCILLERALSSG